MDFSVLGGLEQDLGGLEQDDYFLRRNNSRRMRPIQERWSLSGYVTSYVDAPDTYYVRTFDFKFRNYRVYILLYYFNDNPKEIFIHTDEINGRRHQRETFHDMASFNNYTDERNLPRIIDFELHNLFDTKSRLPMDFKPQEFWGPSLNIPNLTGYNSIPCADYPEIEYVLRATLDSMYPYEEHDTAMMRYKNLAAANAEERGGRRSRRRRSRRTRRRAQH